MAKNPKCAGTTFLGCPLEVGADIAFSEDDGGWAI